MLSGGEYLEESYGCWASFYVSGWTLLARSLWTYCSARRFGVLLVSVCRVGRASLIQRNTYLNISNEDDCIIIISPLVEDLNHSINIHVVGRGAVTIVLSCTLSLWLSLLSNGV